MICDICFIYIIYYMIYARTHFMPNGTTDASGFSWVVPIGVAPIGVNDNFKVEKEKNYQQMWKW